MDAVLRHCLTEAKWKILNSSPDLQYLAACCGFESDLFFLRRSFLTRQTFPLRLCEHRFTAVNEWMPMFHMATTEL